VRERRTVAPDHEPRGQPARGRPLDRGGTEAENLDPIGVGTAREDPRQRLDRAPRERLVGVRLDVELHGQARASSSAPPTPTTTAPNASTPPPAESN
jgi:hypothetical protein